MGYNMHRSVVITATLFLLPWHWLCAAEPRPIRVPPSTEWLGFDGEWSPVQIRVGSPQQWLSLFPSTLAQETWVIASSGCKADSITCVTERGGVFNSNESSTWSSLGSYALNFQPELGDSAAAIYGLDTISIADQVTVPDQIVAILQNADYFLGSLGLGVAETFIDSENRPTFLATMAENQSHIPSRSWGYTAGAIYRLKGVPCSLTLGGMDLNRFVPNDVQFDLTADQEPVISINGISLSADPLSTSSIKPNWTEEPLSLLEASQAELFTIDSSTPFLWLPEKICDAFALALNLTYDETLQLYRYGSGMGPSVLKDWKMNFTFTLADLPSSSKSVDISLPYDAFDQNISFPFPNLNATASSPPVEYFPLRKASNETQYTIGRVFLQEAYMTVDYERNSFSLAQARFANDALTNVDLVSITQPSDGANPGSGQGSSDGISTGVKAGIGVGAAVLVLAILGLSIFFWLRKRRIDPAKDPKVPGEDKGLLTPGVGGKTPVAEEKDLTTTTAALGELPGSRHQPTEASADISRSELPGNPPVEMPAPVPSSYYGLDKGRGGMSPAELDPDDTTAKALGMHGSSRLSASSTLPPYSPNQVGRRSVSNVSPSTMSFPHSGGRGTGTASSEISGISPDSRSGIHIPRRSSQRPTAARSSSNQEVSPGEPSPLTPATPMENPSNQPPPNLLRSQGEDNGAPSRSVSRGSRFREEGIAEEDLHPPPLRPRRFSWDATA